MCQPALGNHCKQTRQKVRCCALKRGHREIQSKHDPENPEQGCSPASFGKPNAGTFGFSGQGGKGQKGSEHSGRVSDSPAVANLVHVTQEVEQTCFEFQNIRITNSEYMQKVFRNVSNRLGNSKGVSQMAMEADKTNISIGHCLWLHRCKQHGMWTRVLQITWKHSRILTLRMLKACSILQER